MKIINKSLIAAALVSGALGTVSAAGIDSVPGVTGTSLNVTVDGDVATVYGQADSGIEASLAENYASHLDGVKRVINLITY